MKLHHIGMKVENLQASKEFYQTYFGYEEELRFKWGSENILFMRKEECRLELIEDPGEESGRTFLHIALEVSDLERELELLKEKGLLPVEGPLLLENGWKMAFFFGPDGEIVELVKG